MTTPLASAAHRGIRGRPICRRSSRAGAVVGSGCVAVVVMVIPSPVFVVVDQAISAAALLTCAGLGSDGLGSVDVSGVPAGESPDETNEREHEPLDQWWDRPATELAVVATE